MKKDLTQGSELKQIALFALPMLAGNIFQQLYNVVDSIVVGRAIGDDALAAVGMSFPIFFIRAEGLIPRRSASGLLILIYCCLYYRSHRKISRLRYIKIACNIFFYIVLYTVL